MRFKTNLKIKSNLIDPVPLVNVVFLIILFFVLAVQCVGETGLLVNLPKAETAVLFKTTSEKITVKGEKVYFREEEVSIGQLKEQLSNKDISTLIIEADKDIPNSKIVELISIAQEKGVDNIAIAAQK